MVEVQRERRGMKYSSNLKVIQCKISVLVLWLEVDFFFPRWQQWENRPKSTRSMSNISYDSLASSKVGSGMCKTHNDESKGISSNFS